jgi:glycosyltransferase involved in cell wall biosynthesis
MTEFEKHPVLSIIIPVYNGDKFIKDAYEDIIQQNLESFEILLVDNNSTDNSVNLIEQYCNLDSRLKYFKEKTQGAAAARNKGIRNAKGEFIYFFDVDDQLYDNSLTVLLNCLQNDKTVDSVFGKKLVSRTRLDNRKNKNEFDIIKKQKPYLGLNWFENLNNL